MSFDIPMPSCKIDEKGRIINVNGHMGDVFLYDDITGADFFTLTGIKAADLFNNSETQESPVMKRNGKTFRLIAYKDKENPENVMNILFSDITLTETLREKYENERPCIAKIQIDNYDQLIDENGSTPNLNLSGEIDKLIRKWGEKIDAQVTRSKNSLYVIWFEHKNISTIKNMKFEILDAVRNLETGADFPASLSIGIGAGGENFVQTEEYANQALDLALGRGGDQAVIKTENKVEYYGGTLQTVEKSNKGKSRIIGHALCRLIDQSKKIFIMGHRYPDMDSFGSALGVHRLCRLREKNPYIVIDEYDEVLEAIFKQAKESDSYNFINSEKAMGLVDRESLVIVVDTHRRSLVQCRGLLDSPAKIVVIDHHRKVDDFIDNSILFYMESYASSASELVAEILQYMSNSKKTVTKLEAEGLLAGMIIDTNNFAVKTGVRTFESAAWLRRQGADPTEVKRLFQEKFENIKMKYQALNEAKIFDNGVAITTLEIVRSDAQLLCAQVADKLLTAKGVRVSFVVGRNKEMKTVISARSLGDVNVQMIMEKFNGGGHLTTAAAQVDSSIDETVNRIMEVMEVQ